MPTQLDIVKQWEYYDVGINGKLYYYTEENKVPRQSLWTDYGEAQCMACQKQIAGAFDAPRAKQKLEKAHILAKSLGGENVAGNLVLLCKKCHQESPDTACSELFFGWLYLKIKHSCFGVDLRDMDKTLKLILQTGAVGLTNKEVTYHGGYHNYENNLYVGVSQALGEMKRQDPLTFNKIYKEYL